MPSHWKNLRNLGQDAKGWLKTNKLNLFPAKSDFSNYKAGDFTSDARAGLNVALLAFPQGLAYAAVAGLPIVYGVTCSAVAAIVAPLFSSSRYTILGPTNATAFMAFSFFARQETGDWQWMPMVVLMAGIILTLSAIFRLADLVQYISRSVVVGYIAGAVILICVNQTQHLFGLDLAKGSGTLWSVIEKTVTNLKNTNLVSLGISVSTLLLFFLFRNRFSKLPIFAITLLLMSLVAAWLGSVGHYTPTYANQSFGPKDLLPSIPDAPRSVYLSKMTDFFTLALGLAFLAALENSVMAQTLAGRLRSGKMPDRNQDMLSVGIANLSTSFLSGMAASGSLTRSALNVSSQASTRFSSIISGLLCLAGAFLLGGYVKYIPKASLAALVICIACSLINKRHITIALNSTRSDAIVLIATLLSTLILPLHIAIFVGIGISLILYLRKASRPYLVEYDFDEKGQLSERKEMTKNQNHPSITIVHVEGELFFGAAELFRSQIYRTCQDPDLKVIILRMKNAHHLDATSVMALETLVEFLHEQDRHLIVSGCMKDVYRVFRDSGLVEVIGRDNIFPGSPQNPTIATKNALERAQELIGDQKAEIKIFYDPAKQDK